MAYVIRKSKRNNQNHKFKFQRAFHYSFSHENLHQREKKLFPSNLSVNNCFSVVDVIKDSQRGIVDYPCISVLHICCLYDYSVYLPESP